MTDASAEGQSDKLSEVVRLATLMADRILEAQIAARPIPQEQFNALVNAAWLLQDYDVPWPPLVEEVLYEAGRRLNRGEAAPEAADHEPEDDGALAGLTRFFGGFRRS
ncbi:hypothetical protein [Methylorubrum extorquens]|uniref:hypothetical protein n=1 Tax=Methylorubrum extorquens TaxID=408 RepID=UPI000158F3CA|nr:hypothetical protein [Methylorubrum extorquens]ABY30265.1 hypothetical protein Mext_1866 [Methylorubrum extorquens PA1]KQP93666.1 hypothetical protein ASF55_20425 [Methylobacterium sp. Leaf119]WIU41565.1 hypothetical protein KQ926_09805 [Methylorubrum extorquens]